jgi:hypothetical protein
VRVVDRRALDRNGRLFVTRQVCNWRLVEASSGVYVDGVDDIFSCLPGLGRSSFVLSSWSKEQAAVRRERQSAEK